MFWGFNDGIGFLEKIAPLHVVKVGIDGAVRNFSHDDALAALSLAEGSFTGGGSVEWSSAPPGISGAGDAIAFSPAALTPGEYTVAAKSARCEGAQDVCTVNIVALDIAAAPGAYWWKAPSAALSLTPGSHLAGGSVAWSSSPPGLSVTSSGGSSFVFSPAASAPGAYVVTARSGALTSVAASHTVTVFKIDVTNMRFNHDTASSSSDALNIRTDRGAAFDLSGGEWDSARDAPLPVCCTASRSVTALARLTVEPMSIASAEIWADSLDFDGSLGALKKRSVSFSGGVSSPEYVEFAVGGLTPGGARKTTNDAWEWKVGVVDGGAITPAVIRQMFGFTVYTVFSEPLAPWGGAYGDARNAWVSALDFAIDAAGAGGANTANAALSAITEHLYSGHGLAYDTKRGAAKYYGEPTFRMSQYISKSNGNVVNCYDQAGAVVMLGRVLGIDADIRYMRPFGYINAVNLVGVGMCNNPFFTNP